jgi:hypothetical protein
VLTSLNALSNARLTPDYTACAAGGRLEAEGVGVIKVSRRAFATADGSDDGQQLRAICESQAHGA